jgi:hypothetical protein
MHNFLLMHRRWVHFMCVDELKKLSDLIKEKQTLQQGVIDSSMYNTCNDNER